MKLAAANFCIWPDERASAEALWTRQRRRDRLAIAIGRLRGRSCASAARRAAPRSALGAHRGAHFAGSSRQAKFAGSSRQAKMVRVYDAKAKLLSAWCTWLRWAELPVPDAIAS